MQALRPKLWAPLVLVLGGVGAFAATQGAPVEAADHNDPPNRVHSGTATADDRAADIADLFAWTHDVSGTSHTVLAFSFDGPNPATPAFELPCDRDVLYQIHLTAAGGVCPTTVDDGGTPATCGTPDTAHPCGQYTPAGTTTPVDCVAAFTDEHTINVRFARVGSATSACYVEAEFVGTDTTPISATSVVGPIETNLGSASGVQLYAGLRDDSFFFDLQGFQETLTTGTLSFQGLTSAGPRDSFAGLNTPVVVIDFPTSAITHSPHALSPAASLVRVWASSARHI